jgi:O-antigen ligase
MNRTFTIKKYLVLLIFVLLPFNGLPYQFQFIGELGYEGAFFGFLISLFITILIFRGRWFVPKNLAFYLIVLFIFWIFISGIVNYNDILSNYFKGRSGLSKFLTQSMVIILSCFTIVFYYNLFKDLNFNSIKNAIIISCIIPFIYSFIEILNFLNITIARNLLLLLEEYIHSFAVYNYVLSEEPKLRSVSGEASWFGTYISFLFPWVLNILIAKKDNKLFNYVILIYLLILVYFTFSRTVYSIVFIQLICFFLLYFLYEKNYKTKIRLIFSSAFMTILAILFLTDNLFSNIFTVLSSLSDPENLSNVARFSSQIAALKMWIDAPIFGVGIGQYGFYMPIYISQKSLILSHEIQEWVTNSINSPWPPVHGLYSRILAEAGIIGLILWVSSWIFLIYKLLHILNKYQTEKLIRLDIISIITTIIGTLLIGFNIDTFRNQTFYISFSMALIYLYYLNKARSH